MGERCSDAECQEPKLTDSAERGFTGSEQSTNVPLVTDLRQDPWERYQDQSMMYARWWGDQLWTLVPSSAIVGQFLQTFQEYPPSQVSGTFSVEQALQQLQAGASGGGK